MNSSSSTIELLYNSIPSDVCQRLGKAFYSGCAAFEGQASLYVLGLNPGGDPSEHKAETVESHTAAVLHNRANWSAYRDESWKDAAPGTSGMQPLVLHMFAALKLDPGLVPCSNLIFVRSRRESDIRQEIKSLAELCWAFHLRAIEQLRPRVIVCFGKRAGRYVCSSLEATKPCDQFIERNHRRWRSQVFASSIGLKIVVATHPSIADWCAPATDPTLLIQGALK